MPVGTLIKLRRDTAANWTSEDPVLEEGEPGFETDTYKLKIGDGSTNWTELDYFAPSVPSEGGSDVHAGYATLATGTVTVAATWVTPTTVIVVTAQAAPGVPGTILYVDPANIVDVTSFEISSDDATDDRAVFWMAMETTELVESGFVMKSNAAAGDAFAIADFGSDRADIWVTFDLAFEQTALDFWDASGFGSGYFGEMHNDVVDDTNNTTIDATYIYDIWLNNALAWKNDGIGGYTEPSPAPVASTWQHIEFHYEGSTATLETYLDGDLLHTFTGGSPESTYDIHAVIFGQRYTEGDPDEVVYIKNIKAGATREASEIFSENFGGDLSAWDVTGDCTIVADPF